MDENDRQDAINSADPEPIEPETAPDIPGATRTAVADGNQDDFTAAPTSPKPGLESTEVIPEPLEAARLEVLHEAEAAPRTGAGPVAETSMSEQGSKRRFLLVALAGLLAVLSLGALAWWLYGGTPESNTSRSEDISSAPIEQPKLGVAITVADGSVEYKRGEADWQAADTTTQIQEGDSVRTGDDSRAVLMLDDGSAVRLDANTSVKLINLTAGQVEIEQGAGAVYSRVVPSERKFIVRVDGTDYQALGTAFMTVFDGRKSGVQVFQSAVRASDLPDETIGEGKQFFRPFGDYIGPLEITDIDIDELTKNSFVSWNLERDQADNNFKAKLGILPRVKQRTEELHLEHESELKVRQQTEQEVAERAEAEKQEAKTMSAHTSGEKVRRGTMVLSQTGKTLYWAYTGQAYHGYKLVYSKTNESPVFGRDDSVYFSSIKDGSGTLPSKDKIGGGKYYVRVCAYTDGTETERCVDYSNIVVINL